MIMQCEMRLYLKIKSDDHTSLRTDDREEIDSSTKIKKE